MAAPHHVPLDPNLSTGPAMFGEQHEPYSYNQNFSGAQEDVFNGGYYAPTVDPNLSQGAPYTNAAFGHNWNDARAQSSTPTLFDYPQLYTNNPASFPNSQPGAHGGQTFTNTHGVPAGAFTTSAPSAPSATVSPAALRGGPSVLANTPNQVAAIAPRPATLAPSSQPVVKPSTPEMAAITRPEPPKGVKDGKFLVIDLHELSNATQSQKLHKFLSIGTIPQQLQITKTTIPAYVPRKSVNELRSLAINDPKLATRIAKAKAKPKQSGSTVPKAVRLKPYSAASPQSRTSVDSSSDSEASDDDSDYESSDSEEEEPEPSPLPASRPQQPAEAVRYDTIKALWLPRNLPVDTQQARAALAAFWEIMKTIRDRWRTDTEAVKQAKEKKKEAELPMLKARVKDQRDMLEIALRAALEYGHSDIIRRLGDSGTHVFALYQFMKERVADGDYDASFVVAALQLLTKCSTLTTTTLEKTGLNKLLPRLVKNGNDTVKAMAKRVMDIAKKKDDESKTSRSADGTNADAKPKQGMPQRPASASDKTAGVKQTPSTTSSSQPARRTASAAVSTAAKLGLLKTPASATTKPRGQTASKTPTTNMFSSLPVVKKTNGNGAAQKAKPTVPEKKATPMSSSGFSLFAETMASLNKPNQPAAAVKKEENLPPETEEERAKRLRKESRRHLRVTFKPEESLTETHYFEHDPEEELGHDANMVRDVADLNSEGRMFKQHKEMMDIDEDDDEPLERDYFDFKSPTRVDFSEIAADASQNYEPYGGGRHKPDSPEKAIQDRHVANAMMVHYFTRADIPSCPHEPVDPYTGDRQETRIGAVPEPNSTYGRRAKAVDSQGEVAALLAGLNALAPPAALAASPAAAPVGASAAQQQTGDQSINTIQNILAQFGQPAQQPQTPAQPQYQQPAAPAHQSIADIIAALSGQGQAQQQPTQPAAAPTSAWSQQDQPQYPTAASIASRPQQQPTEQSVAAPRASWPQQWPTTWPTSYAGASTTSYAGAPTTNGPTAPGPDAAAILAMFGFNPAAMPNYYGQHGQQQQGGDAYAAQYQPAQQNDQYAGNTSGGAGRKRGREDDNQQQQYQQGGGKKWKKKKGFGDHEPPKYVLPCKFFKEGKCRKGANCTYRHDRDA